MLNLDMRTIFIMGTFLYLLMAICLFAFWLQHRKYFKGIGIFTLSLSLLTAGIIGTGLQGSLHPFLTVVISNTLLILSISLTVKSFHYFFYGTDRYGNFLYVFPVIIFIEQYIFTFIHPSLFARILFVSSVFIMVLAINILVIASSNKRNTFSGIILMSSFAVIAITFIIRIPVTIFTLNTDVYLSAGINQAIPILLVTVPAITVSMGFVLLVSQELQNIEQKRVVEKEQLLREVHHRIKNNMQTMESILILQAESAPNQAVQDALNNAAERLTSMMVLYDKLYRGEILDKISARGFLLPLIDEIIKYSPISITLEKNFDDALLTVKTASFIGIIINELISNAMKYAFTENKTNNTIAVSLVKSESRVKITVHDNGIGFSSGKDNKGFGISLSRTMAEQIDGTLIIEQDKGTRCIIEFPLESQL